MNKDKIVKSVNHLEINKNIKAKIQDGNIDLIVKKIN